MNKNYQLTSYPIGSFREIWTLSYPLILSFISANLMCFVDRILLSWYDPAAANGSAVGQMGYFFFLILPMSICGITEVLVGRLNGAGEFQKIGHTTWQAIWFALGLTPLFGLISWLLPGFIFNTVHESSYFQILIAFAPLFLMQIALTGFFVGTGRVRVVTVLTVAANLVNGLLAYLLIFGFWQIPALGIKGAALATGVAQLLGGVFLLLMFLRAKYREKYETTRLRFRWSILQEAMRIAIPSGLAHAIEILGHFAFFRIVMLSGELNMTICVIVQSFYFILGTLVQAIGQATSAVVANLLGAKRQAQIAQVTKAALLLHSCFFLAAACLLLFPQVLLQLFTTDASRTLLENSQALHVFARAFGWMVLFFLLDGWVWILVGHFRAAGDTKFLLIAGTILSIFYVGPIYLFIGAGKGGADIAWLIIALVTCLQLAIYSWRYVSKRWLRASAKVKL